MFLAMGITGKVGGATARPTRWRDMTGRSRRREM